MILHITNDYSGSTVYKNLIGELDKLNLAQIVYNPIKDKERIDKNKIEFKCKESLILYSHILNKTIDRVLYKRKIYKIVRDIEKRIDLSKITFIHAHTWYSDGGVAYLLWKKYNIPYIVTIRNSDINVFQKYLIWQRSFGASILENSKNIILIAASYKSRVLSEGSLMKIKEKLALKIRVIPNGVDSYWTENVLYRKLEVKEKYNVLFVGKFTYGKNILPLQLAIKMINEERESALVHLHLIGGGGKVHNEVLNTVNQNISTMTFHGKIFELSKLKEYFENADIFAMPSKRETFGLVYVEAMLQGLPILYTQNEGIDGFYIEKIGEKVTSSEVIEIKEKLLKLMNNYSSYEIPTSKLLGNHNWKNIAFIYQELYTIDL
ncbi:glycosyltransferase family 4 protein [Myroides odoratimimus]|uniref:glycosyltransferase family 4 protein n=1 Tax=Myroides odoratimimus TaxID=76832 RepID=UPI002574E391|nr:glycosyltransferase family 4 protein [Myroides odoratimimus]MDM1517659.1 glycosyltransferase family 4 protein [Myroides odoratimimus]